jgi:2-methylaconitate cis-trans-isomerase PrpF
VVDAVNLCVFAWADDLGLSGSELPAEIQEDEGVLQRLELIRGTICEELGLVDDALEAATVRPATPLIGVVAEPRSYETSVGGRVSAADVDVTSRMISSQSPHHAYPVTGAMCLAAATKLPGTVPNEVAPDPRSIDEVTIGHPKGTISIGVTRTDGTDDPSADGDGPIEQVSVGRTARAIMSGKVYYHESRAE